MERRFEQDGGVEGGGVTTCMHSMPMVILLILFNPIESSKLVLFHKINMKIVI